MRWKFSFCEGGRLAETLEQVKRRIRSAYLGANHIHAVGLRRAENAVCLYVHGGNDAMDTALLRKIEADAQPFSVIVVSEDAPMIAGEDG